MLPGEPCPAGGDHDRCEVGRDAAVICSQSIMVGTGKGVAS